MPDREEVVIGRAAQQPQPAPREGSPARLTDGLSDMLVRNPAPDGSPSREPTGMYRIITR